MEYPKILEDLTNTNSWKQYFDTTIYEKYIKALKFKKEREDLEIEKVKVLGFSLHLMMIFEIFDNAKKQKIKHGVELIGKYSSDLLNNYIKKNQLDERFIIPSNKKGSYCFVGSIDSANSEANMWHDKKLYEKNENELEKIFQENEKEIFEAIKFVEKALEKNYKKIKEYEKEEEKIKNANLTRNLMIAIFDRAYGKTWRKNFFLTKDFTEKNKCLPSKTSENLEEKELGMWVESRRRENKNLEMLNGEIRELERIKCWSWEE